MQHVTSPCYMPHGISPWIICAVFSFPSNLFSKYLSTIIFAQTDFAWEIETVCKRIEVSENLNKFSNFQNEKKLISSLFCHIARPTCTLPRVATKPPHCHWLLDSLFLVPGTLSPKGEPLHIRHNPTCVEFNRSLRNAWLTPFDHHL